MSNPINTAVNKIILAWAGLLEAIGKAEVTATRGLSGWDVQDVTKTLNESRDLDSSGLTTFMLMQAILKSFLQKTTFSAHDLINRAPDCAALIDPARALNLQLQHPTVISAVDDFHADLLDAAEHYGVEDIETLQVWLDDYRSISYVRRDALRSMRALKVHQFAQGEPAKTELQANHQVYEFWNINSLLQALRMQKLPGISMILIREPMTLHSFFAFAISNGETITLLTDKPTHPHPDFKNMSRRPDRALFSRAGEHWFPYDLLHLAVDEERRAAYAIKRDQLVRTSAQAVPLKHIKDLHPAQFIWTILMLDQIKDKYGRLNHHIEDLSYTGEMVQDPAALIGENSALARRGGYKTLEAAYFEQKDVTAEATAEQWRQKPSAHHQWMVDRYRKAVPDTAFNPLGDASLEEVRKVFEERTGLPARTEPRWSKDKPRDLLNVSALDPTFFGSQADIKRDRLWHARKNQMGYIRQLAEEEFKNTKEEALAWYRERVRTNRDFLLNAAACGNITLPVQPNGTFKHGIQPYSVLTQPVIRAVAPSPPAHWWRRYGALLDSGRASTRITRLCCDRPNTKATVWACLFPSFYGALATVCGLDSVEELPWYFRYWYHRNVVPYSGNSILDRLDPLDWVLRDPWCELDMTISVALCKGAVHARRKALSLPRQTWEGIGNTLDTWIVYVPQQKRQKPPTPKGDGS